MTELLSDRINALEESATIAMAQKTRELRAQGVDIISLTLGEPDFSTPEHIREAAKAAIDEGRYFSYPPVAGYPELRKAIAEKLQVENQIPSTPEQVMVTNGAKHAIANILFCLLNPGDEVIVFAPYWVSYVGMIKMAGGVPVIVNGSMKNGFKVMAGQVENALTGRTKAVIYSSPCNPTGAVFTREELEKIAAVLSRRDNIMVIADEIYEYITYTGKTVSMGAIPDMQDNTVTVNGFSKGFAMTGWRAGYLSGPAWLTKACIKMQGQLTSGINTIAQRAALAALKGNREPVRLMVGKYRERRDMVLDLLKEIPGLKTPVPDGAFYFFPDVSAFFGMTDGTTRCKNADDLCMYLLDDARVSTVSGTAFGAPGCIRLSYAASDEDLKTAIGRIGESLTKLR